VILGMRQKEMESAEAFRVAIHLAPTYAEVYSNLAGLRFRQGFAKEATGLQTEAVKHAPENLGYAERLAAYRAVAGQLAEAPSAAPGLPPDEPMSGWPSRPVELDWRGLADRLTRDGCVVLPQLVDATTCADLRDMFDHDTLFAKTVFMDRPEFGLGVYRYFRAPIPRVVDQLRRAVYPHVARIANDWQRLLNEPQRFPEEWAGFRDECQRAGQTTPTPILLKYEPGGFNAPHRDLRGTVFFRSKWRSSLAHARIHRRDFAAARFCCATFRRARSCAAGKSRPGWATESCSVRVIGSSRWAVRAACNRSSTAWLRSRPACAMCSACRSTSIGNAASQAASGMRMPIRAGHAAVSGKLEARSELAK
jgi:hypothetical protein